MPALLAGTALGPLLGCHGGGTSAGPVATAAGFTLTVSQPSLALYPGGSGTVTVGLVRQGGFAGAVSLGLANAPAGVTASGSIAAGEASGKLAIWVESGAAAHAYPNLTVTGTAAGMSQSAPFALTLLSGVSSLPVERVQAAGAVQRSANGAIQNQPVAGEPVRTTSATSNPIENRSGFAPNGQ